jgi:hypothetical protein
MDVSSLNDGTLTTAITSTDTAGNQTTSTDVISKDTVFGNNADGTDEGVTADIVDSSDTGDSNTDNITNIQTLIFSGAKESNERIVVTKEKSNNVMHQSTYIATKTKELIVNMDDTQGEGKGLKKVK